MVSLVTNDRFLSLESKGGTLSTNEELDHYRQRFQSMKLVLKELHQQVGQYKTRCAGVDTIALMLKESRQEVVKLTKQRKALETAVANLQNRLSANGLSSSLKIEETEQFVPGASKQTIDNLARENGRLRSLLKNVDKQKDDKSNDEIQSLKSSLEILESENSQLKAQNLELENLKTVITMQYEELVAKLKQAPETEKLVHESELNQYPRGQSAEPEHSEREIKVEEVNKPTQSEASIKVDEIRRALKFVSDQCLALDTSLENIHIPSNNEECLISDKMAIIKEEVFMEQEKKLSQIILMNQRWQSYNLSQEQQIHALMAQIAELEQATKDVDSLRNVVTTKDLENESLKKEIDKLIEANKKRPVFDVSIVEILKQQIQVCTEDFNTERKDRENAVNKVKLLQEEVNKLSNEKEQLKKELDNVQRIKITPELDRQDNQLWTRNPPQMHYFATRGAHSPAQRLPNTSNSSLGTPPLSSAASSSPDVLYLHSPSVAERAALYQTPQKDLMSRLRGPIQVGGNKQLSSHGFQDSSQFANVVKSSVSNLSMPTLSRRSESPSRVKSKQTDLTCPKCNKAYTEDQHSELISHINMCKD